MTWGLEHGELLAFPKEPREPPPASAAAAAAAEAAAAAAWQGGLRMAEDGDAFGTMCQENVEIGL